MAIDPAYKPRLRPVEAFPLPDAKDVVGVRDRDGMTGMMLTVSGPALKLLSLMDGVHTIDEIRTNFFAVYGQPVNLDTIESMVVNLEQSCFLEGKPFETLHAERTKEYRAKGVRPALHLPYDRQQLSRLFDAILDEFDHAQLAIDASKISRGCDRQDSNLQEPLPHGRGSVDATADPQVLVNRYTGVVAADIRGVIAPHLDYARGAPCYGAAYGAIRNRPAPRRVVILGTNHFGRGSDAVVATVSHFETPLGQTKCDVDFIERVESKTGGLRRFELDHAREHSIELQVAWLQHLYGPDQFSIVPVLCPDPRSSLESAGSPRGVSYDFAQAIRMSLEDDTTDTLMIAGADLSHVGAAFGDERDLEPEFLQFVREHNQSALLHLQSANPDGFAARVADDGNSTRVCSTGCIYTLAKVLAPTKAHLLHYHQAVDERHQSCVTCTAAIYP